VAGCSCSISEHHAFHHYSRQPPLLKDRVWTLLLYSRLQNADNFALISDHLSNSQNLNIPCHKFNKSEFTRTYTTLLVVWLVVGSRNCISLCVCVICLNEVLQQYFRSDMFKILINTRIYVQTHSLIIEIYFTLPIHYHYSRQKTIKSPNLLLI
jgi:hypothetical protein